MNTNIFCEACGNIMWRVMTMGNSTSLIKDDVLVNGELLACSNSNCMWNGVLVVKTVNKRNGELCGGGTNDYVPLPGGGAVG